MSKLLALCSSRRCSELRFENKTNYAIKDVSKNVNTCPDCGSALLWKKENSKAKVKDIVHRQNKPKALR